MTRFIGGLRAVNPTSSVILTVSPVPLNATALDRHVLVSTSYSKAVLRVAAEKLSTTLDRVHYFPAYEIVTGPFSRGRYFAEDLRSVTEAGVEHVMSLFFRHATTTGGLRKEPASQAHDAPAPVGAIGMALEVQCDEELLILDSPSGSG